MNGRWRGIASRRVAFGCGGNWRWPRLNGPETTAAICIANRANTPCEPSATERTHYTSPHKQTGSTSIIVINQPMVIFTRRRRRRIKKIITDK